MEDQKTLPLAATATLVIIDDEPAEIKFHDQIVPFIVGYDATGAITARDLAQRQRIDPANCDHAGASWSASFARSCPRCGSAIFLPPRLLAYLTEGTIGAMHELWCAAGWPEWCGTGWNVLSNAWAIQPHPLFAHCGGLPVRNDHQDQYLATCQEYDL
jgi:hypothetical protein